MKKNLFTLITILIFTLSVMGQDKKIIKVDDDLYSYTENTINDSTHQTGFFKIKNDKLKRDGLWKLYINGELKHKAIYKNDELKLITIYKLEYTDKELDMLRSNKDNQES